MPDVDGYDFIRQVRALAARDGGDTPAIALTAYARTQDAERVLAAGFQAHATKPVDGAKLVELVASFAAGRLLQPGVAAR